MLDDLTVYFITTDRDGASAALASLEDGQDLLHPVVVVRNVRPLAAAYRASLDCKTEFCAVVDDDVLMRPGFLADALAELVALRATAPNNYQLSGHRFTDDDDLIGGSGFKLYHAPSLRRVGFPDAVHVTIAQDRAAEALGLRRHPSGQVVGARVLGTLDDVYKRHLWVQLRWNLSENPWWRRPRPLRLLHRAITTGDPAYSAALLGAIDGVLAGFVRGSKDEAFLGPIAAERGVDDLEDLTPLRVLARAAPYAGRLVLSGAAILARNVAVRTPRRVAARFGGSGR